VKINLKGARKLLILPVAAALVIGLSACEPESDKKQREQSEKIQQDVIDSVGMPDTSNHAEARQANELMELRDKEVLTWSYLKNLDGSLTCIGRTVGFGLPYGVQITNPEKKVTDHDLTLPQAEPNGLFVPDNAAATWIRLYDPATKKTVPMYVEDNVMASPVRLHKPGTPCLTDNADAYGVELKPGS